MEWISVKDKLPNSGVFCLCTFQDNLPYVAEYDIDKKAWVDIWEHKFNCSHWMPLPELPEK